SSTVSAAGRWMRSRGRMLRMRPRPALLCAVLGANLWATVVLVPSLYGGRHGLARLAAALPLALLVWACARPTDARLLFMFPLLVAVCAGLGASASAPLPGAPALVLSAAALVAYLVAAARTAEAVSRPAPVPTQPLGE